MVVQLGGQDHCQHKLGPCVPFPLTASFALVHTITFCAHIISSLVTPLGVRCIGTMTDLALLLGLH